MKKNSLTLTVVANMTSNYSENLGNIASVQKIFKNGKVYSIRSRESLKNAIMVQSGMYDDLQTDVYKKVAQKLVNKEVSVANTKALEGGYMSTKSITYVRSSSFYLTDAVSCDAFVNETRFHNNLFLATNRANAIGENVQNVDKKVQEKVGLLPYQYEFDKSLKVYSITIDLEMIGVDKNFDDEASSEEKAERVISILNAIKNLSLIVKGNMDNSEPIFVVGGLSERKTHYFENVVHIKNNRLLISDDLKQKLSEGFNVALLKGMILENESEIVSVLNPISISEFFKNLEADVKNYYSC